MTIPSCGCEALEQNLEKFQLPNADLEVGNLLGPWRMAGGCPFFLPVPSGKLT